MTLPINSDFLSFIETETLKCKAAVAINTGLVVELFIINKLVINKLVI